MGQLLSFGPFAVNDVKPIVLQGVTSANGSAITTASYQYFLRTMGTPSLLGNPGPYGNTASINGQDVTSGNITWSTAGLFVMQFKLTFADSTVDYGIEAFITVSALTV